MLLCPSSCFTWIMSFVLWYSVVAFQCRKVWKVILFSRGFFSLVAVLLRRASYVIRSVCLFRGNIFSFCLCVLFSMFMSLLLIGSIRLLLPFSASMWMVFLLRSMSVHLVSVASPILAPVSLSSCRSRLVFGVPLFISVSSSFSVGMNGKAVCFLYFGLSHFFPIYFKYPVYTTATLCLLLFFHVVLAKTSFTSSGLFMLHCLSNRFNFCIVVVMVSFALPCFFICQP